jgi:hypothetical protein
MKLIMASIPSMFVGGMLSRLGIGLGDRMFWLFVVPVALISAAIYAHSRAKERARIADR